MPSRCLCYKTSGGKRGTYHGTATDFSAIFPRFSRTRLGRRAPGNAGHFNGCRNACVQSACISQQGISQGDGSGPRDCRLQRQTHNICRAVGSSDWATAEELDEDLLEASPDESSLSVADQTDEPSKVGTMQVWTIQTLIRTQHFYDFKAV